jgi:hypothetical protein
VSPGPGFDGRRYDCTRDELEGFDPSGRLSSEPGPNPSIEDLRAALNEIQALQRPTDEELQELVHKSFTFFYVDSIGDYLRWMAEWIEDRIREQFCACETCRDTGAIVQRCPPEVLQCPDCA